MKKLNLLFSLIGLLMGSCILSSCDSIIDDRIVDWVPAELYITVEDRYGNDLLDTLSNSCVVDFISATFRGETLEVRKNCHGEHGGMLPCNVGTRYYLPMWYGLCLINEQMVWNGHQWNLEKTDKFMLYLGEIDGAKDMDEDLTLTFDSALFNRQKHVIHYHCSDHKESKGSCKRWFSLDGEKAESNKIRIVL